MPAPPIARPIILTPRRPLDGFRAEFAGDVHAEFVGLGRTRYDAIVDLLFQVEPAPVTP